MHRDSAAAERYPFLYSSFYVGKKASSRIKKSEWTSLSHRTLLSSPGSIFELTSWSYCYGTKKISEKRPLSDILFGWIMPPSLRAFALLWWLHDIGNLVYNSFGKKRTHAKYNNISCIVPYKRQSVQKNAKNWMAFFQRLASLYANTHLNFSVLFSRDSQRQ